MNFLKVLIVLLASAVLLPIAVAADAQTAGGAEPKPGEKIDKTNVDKYASFISPGVKASVENGSELLVVPYQKIPVPKAYVAATEKYSAQATLDERNDLKNWVAGRPFPIVDPNDPKAAVKVMWNFGRTSYFSDDLGVHLPDADTGAFFKNADGKPTYQVERHFIVDWSRNLRFFGRLHNDPRPIIADNPDQVFNKAGFFPLIEPFDLKGVGTVSFRYIDPTRQDDTWLYTPAIRRVRRLSSAQRSDALFGQDIDLDSFGGYAGQIPWSDWKLIGKKPMLASLHGKNLPPKVCPNDGGVTYCEDWEVRPNVWIVEGRSKLQGYAYSKRVIYVDDEAQMIPYSDLYDHNDELWKVVLINIRTSTRPNPKVDLTYPEERMFVYGFTVLDLQLGHGTRAAIPGMAFPDEAGWYLDRGMDAPESVSINWFSIPSLISAGR
ncbi:MAG TPA: DUF1329 domain-containing protein [Candidatus Binatia bacterium]|nr:DUF1329 domain-containing protein [Candidatus Binatia bacterium]